MKARTCRYGRLPPLRTSGLASRVTVMGHERRSPWPLSISAPRSGSGRPRSHTHTSGGPLGLTVPQVWRPASCPRLRIGVLPSQLRSLCRLRQRSETLGQAVQLPGTRKVSGGCPGRCLVGERGQRCRAVHRRDPAIKPKFICLHRQLASFERLFERAVLAQQLRRTLRSDNRVLIRSGRLVVETRFPDDRNWTRVLVRRWMRQRAREVLRERYEAARPTMAVLGIQPPPLVICPMKKRWGSHTPSGRVLLNDMLIAARRDCIDYVIVHELCHVVEANHSPRFFRLLRRFMPDWERRKNLLEQSTI